jgi:hypothetical protein
MPSKAPTSAKQPYTATEILFQDTNIPSPRLLYAEGPTSLRPTGCFRTAVRPTKRCQLPPIRSRPFLDMTDLSWPYFCLTCSIQSLEFMVESEESPAVPDDTAKPLTPGVTTVVVPAATKKQEQTAVQTKRERDREYQRKKRANGSRRSTGTGSDEEVVTTARRGTKRARVDDA